MASLLGLGRAILELSWHTRGPCRCHLELARRIGKVSGGFKEGKALVAGPPGDLMEGKSLAGGPLKPSILNLDLISHLSGPDRCVMHVQIPGCTLEVKF